MHIDSKIKFVPSNFFLNHIIRTFYMNIHPKPNRVGFVSSPKSPNVLNPQCT